VHQRRLSPQQSLVPSRPPLRRSLRLLPWQSRQLPRQSSSPLRRRRYPLRLRQRSQLPPSPPLPKRHRSQSQLPPSPPLSNQPPSLRSQPLNPPPRSLSWRSLLRLHLLLLNPSLHRLQSSPLRLSLLRHRYQRPSLLL
jgi:hypothetical protein